MKRRDFLKTSAAAAFLQSNVGRLGTTLPTGTGGGGGGYVSKPVLQLTDLTSLGSFKIPDPSGDTAAFGSGLALRYVSGTPRLYSVGYKGYTVEYAIPADANLHPVGDAAWVTATVTAQWGDVWGTSFYSMADGGGSPPPPYVGITNMPDGFRSALIGLYADAREGYARLYVTHVTNYSNVNSSDTVLGYATLNDSNTSTTPGRMHILSQVAAYGNRWAGGIVGIPTAFANTYTGGRTLGVGMGAGYSIITNGPCSAGPSLFAINPPTNADPDRGEITTGIVRMANYPYHSNYAAPFFAARPASVPLLVGNDGDDWNNYTTYFGPWMESMRGGVWVDGPTKAGVIVPTNFVGGNLSGTIAASPAPTNLSLTIAGGFGGTNDLATGEYITFQPTTYLSHLATDGGYASALITGVSGNDLTLNRSGLIGETWGDPLAGRPIFAGERYVGGGPSACRWFLGWYIVNPDDLALIAQGLAAQDSATLQAGVYQESGLNLTLPGTPTGANAVYQNCGAAYDPATKRLYVAHMSSAQFVSVYAVNC